MSNQAFSNPKKTEQGTAISPYRNRKRLLFVTIAVAAAICFLSMFFFQQSSQGAPQTVAREETISRGDIIVSLTEEGTASVSTETTGLDLNVTLDDDTKLDLSVKVDEILVRAGENVAAGQPLFILDQESLNKALDTLNNAYTQAQLNLNQAQLDLELGQAKAAGAFNESVSEASAAEDNYHNSVAQMEINLTSYEENIRQLEEDLEKYTKLAELYNVRTATLNNIKSLVTYYEDALKALEDFYDDYNSTNADYKNSYNNYKSKLSTLQSSLENTQSNYEAYQEDADKASAYYEAYQNAISEFNNAVEIINKYQSVVDEYDTLDHRIADAEDCLSEAKEKYNEYQEDYDEWYNGYRSQSSLDNKVAQLKLELENAKLTLENYQANYEANITKAETSKNTSATTGEIAQLTYDSTINKLQQQVISAQLSANNLGAYVNELASCLQDNVILSPCDGLVTNIAFEAGDKIDLVYNYITIAQDDRVTVSLTIDQEDITAVALDQQALVSFDTKEDIIYEGWVDAISVSPASMGSPTVSYTVTVVVESDDLSEIYEGMSCTIDLVTDRMDNVLTISKRAVFTEDGKSYVKVKQEDGSSILQEITLGFTDGSNYEVVAGLNEGDIVLIESQISGSGITTSNLSSGQTGGTMSAQPEGQRPNGEGGMEGAPARNS